MNHLNFYSLAKEILLLFFSIFICITSLFAESPKEMIRDFVAAQDCKVTAYDIAAHFNAPMTDPTYGAPNVFNAAFTSNISIAALDATHFVVAYRDEGNSLHGTAIVGVVSGTTIQSYGSENVFNAATTWELNLSALDATHFVVAYRDGGNSNHGTAIVGVVSGTTIQSYGSENVFNAADTDYISVVALDATHFVVAYRDVLNLFNGTAIVGLVSGTTIQSYGSENVFNVSNSSTIGDIRVATLDATHFVVAYADPANSNYGTAIVGLVSGTTIQSYGSENVFNAANTSNISITVLDATHFVVAYADNGNSNHGTAIVGLVSGTTIQSYGSENVFNAIFTSSISVAALDVSSFVIVYHDGLYLSSICFGGPCTYQSIIGDVSGTTITGYGNEVEIDNSQGEALVNPISVANIGSFVVGYKDIGTNEGTGIVASTPALPVELVRFEAKGMEDEVQLSWQTASEFNNKGFEIEHVNRHGEWESIGFVEGDIYAVTLNNYSFTDADPLHGINYYRLKQLDLDGNFEYSDVVSLEMGSKDAFNITSVYSEEHQLSVTFTTPNENDIKINLYDLYGRLIISEKHFTNEGSNRVDLNIDELASGAYLVQFSDGRQRVSKRFLKQ